MQLSPQVDTFADEEAREALEDADADLDDGSEPESERDTKPAAKANGKNSKRKKENFPASTLLELVRLANDADILCVKHGERGKAWKRLSDALAVTGARHSPQTLKNKIDALIQYHEVSPHLLSFT